MDVHIFRRFCDALCPLLTGGRLEKIQSPLENVFVLTFYANQRKHHLVFKAGRRDAFCYLAKERPVTDAPPSAMVMRWRKYCSGRRVLSCTANWIERKIIFLFHNSNNSLNNTAPETWLVLDLREGPQLFLGSSPDLNVMEQETSWPNALHLADACDNWRAWPVLSPALRRTLADLDPLESSALLMDLEMGGGDLYVYENTVSNQDAVDRTLNISAWPLPLSPHSDTEEKAFDNPLEATSYVGDALVLGVLEEKIRQKAALPHQRELTRLQRLLEKLSDDEQRLLNMQKAQEIGLVLQSELWKYPAHVKEKSITTDNPEHPIIQLDAKLNIRENMQALFHKAARGRRGLEYLQKRRQELEANIQALSTLAQTVESGAHNLHKKNNKTNAQKASALPGIPKGVQAFKSSDGFIILRGKDAKGNGAALRTAAAKDIWMHVEGGPGSHCIIRRHYSGQEIPERTLNEAACLAAIKSWQKDNPTAQILSAEVRHVKAMRGAALGTVRIDKVLQSFSVDIDKDIEQKLSVS